MTIEVGGWVADQAFVYPIELSDAEPDVPTWLHAMPVGTYDHPVYGKIDLTPERISKFADNVKRKTRGQELDIDYDHKAKTDEAAGWVKDAEARTDGLWIAVEWTKTAAGKIKEKAYRYFSPEFATKWKHPKSGAVFADVLFGGALTNRPFLKDLRPITFSENGGNDLDPELLKALGLPADADAKAVLAKVTDLGNAVKPLPPPAGVDPNTVAPQLSELNGQLTKLAETNQALTERLAAVETGARLAETALKLNELNTGKKVAFAPVVLDEGKALMSELPRAQADKLYAFMDKVLDNGIVQLGESAGNNPKNHTDGDDDAVKRFNEEIDKLTTGDNKMEYTDAVLRITAEQPQLYNEYRDAVYVREGAK